MSTTTTTVPPPPGYKLIFRPYRTLKDGTKLFASTVGKKAWPMWVPDDDKDDGKK